MTTQLWDLKLGAYITVPGELQDYFPQLPKVAHYCTGCGTEVPATVRPGPQWCAACDNPAVKARVRHRARMAVQKAAQVDGPVPPATVRAIINSGPCAYCGAEATTSDHVRALVQGGADVADNLVPACLRCNSSKHGRLLTDWDPARVAHAVACSPIVAAEYDRLTRTSVFMPEPDAQPPF